MASDARVKEILGDELKSCAPARSADAGAQWTKKDMGFFFPENEDTVDLCVLATLDRALAHDKVTITKKVRENVAVFRVFTQNASNRAVLFAVVNNAPMTRERTERHA